MKPDDDFPSLTDAEAEQAKRGAKDIPGAAERIYAALREMHARRMREAILRRRAAEGEDAEREAAIDELDRMWE